jgi:hypothetical protein
MSKSKPKVRTPGVEKDAVTGAAGESDPDAAIAAAAEGSARKIEKPRAPVAPSKIIGDPQRGGDAPVNRKRETSYAEAMEMLLAEKEEKELREERVRLREDLANLGDEADERDLKAEIQSRMAVIRARIAEISKMPRLKRPVLTEQGWVAPLEIRTPEQARI